MRVKKEDAKDQENRSWIFGDQRQTWASVAVKVNLIFTLVYYIIVFSSGFFVLLKTSTGFMYEYRWAEIQTTVHWWW